MAQKLFRGQRVRVDSMPDHMRHFRGNCEAIIVGSYSDLCHLTGGMHDKQFSLLLLDKDGKPDGTCSWYYESQLTMLSDDRHAGEELIQADKRRR